jgi:predicted small metal-binding protein
MAKQLRCGDLMPGCKTVIEGKDDNEVLTKAAEHARRDHQINEVTPDLEKQVRAAIHEKA